MKLVMTVQRFHRLPMPVREVGLDWLDRVAPDRYTLEFEVRDEHRCRVKATLAGERKAESLTLLNRPHVDASLVTRWIDADEMPPLAVLREMEVAA